MTGFPRRALLIVGFAGLVVALMIAGVLVAFHPRWYHPPKLSPTEKTVVEVGGQLEAPVEILVDSFGVPHIYGQTIDQLAFGMGFMHGRERSFQTELVRRAAWGRLTELFGEDLLNTDRRMRLLTYGIEEQYEALPQGEKDLLEAYSKGVNAGAAHAGNPAQLALLRTTFSGFEPIDALAIARLQAWNLALDADAELQRQRILARLPAGDPRRALIMKPIPSGGVPIVETPLEKAGEGGPSQKGPRRKGNGKDGVPIRMLNPVPLEGEGSSPDVDDSWWLRQLGLLPGASNSWAIGGEHTRGGAPVLCNDPHLSHRVPSVFFLAHLEHPDFTAVGVTFPGIPAVLIGHTRHFAWGVTTSYADTQDLVRLATTPDSSNSYVVDGVEKELKDWPQRFLDPDGDVLSEELWKISMFGPVLPPSWGTGRPHALMWVGFTMDPIHYNSFTAAWKLYAAKTLEEADEALDQFTFGGQNMLLAFADGDIAYRLGAALPVRREGVNSHLPQDGSRADVRWNGFHLGPRRVRTTNPDKGYIVAANQRVVDDDNPLAELVGRYGVPPYRAERIAERLEELLDKGDVTVEEACAIQHDPVSTAARRVAPVLAQQCPEVLGRADGFAALRSSFCEALQGFDGSFVVESRGAIVYEQWMRAIRERIASDLGVPDCSGCSFIRSSVEAALLEVGGGAESPLLQPSATEILASAAMVALSRLVEAQGSDPVLWSWGRSHVLIREGPLARAPVIGDWFRIGESPEAGHGDAPRAEAGLPVKTGAAFRMAAELRAPPEVRMAIDTGQSGHPGAEHWDDAIPSWRGDEALWAIPIRREEILEDIAGTIELRP